ncbi:MAG: PadR family transcriptional regulator [Gemmatimonadota bacterium]|nr:PadR family transcriptional regulator [Gemmatimonadota bacterium]
MADRRFLMGTLDVLLLKTLSWGPMHGFAIALWLEQTAGQALQIEDGSLYPALHRLERKGWVTSSWGTTENNRRAKYYELTPAGERRLAQETSEWARFAEAVGTVLGATRGPVPAAAGS